jgi:hypothetical protein
MNDSVAATARIFCLPSSTKEEEGRNLRVVCVCIMMRDRSTIHILDKPEKI